MKKILPYLLTALVTAALIYLTPLKWITIIEPTVSDIDPTEFYNEYVKDPGHFIFLDVRGPDLYDAGHAKGSVNAPLHTLYDLRHSLPKHGKEIILICSGGRASGVGFSYLQHYGFFNIHRIEGGIENWVLQGLPVEVTSATSSPVVSLSAQEIPGCTA